MMPTSEQIEKVARLRCPFCGSRGIDRNSSGHKECYCTNCGASGPKVKVDWNTRAALTAAEGVKPRVKPLEWDGMDARAFDLFWSVRESKSTPPFWIARAPGGQLENGFGGLKFNTIEAAKAAAQADYEARILSALQEGE